MKCLSVRQPFADMICAGKKWIEFRARSTAYRGPLAIAAAKSGCKITVEINGDQKPLPTGVILAVVDLVGCRPMSEDDLGHPGAPKFSSLLTGKQTEIRRGMT